MVYNVYQTSREKAKWHGIPIRGGGGGAVLVFYYIKNGENNGGTVFGGHGIRLAGIEGFFYLQYLEIFLKALSSIYFIF